MMKNLMNKAILASLLTLGLTISTPADACTTVLAGRGATANGAWIMSRTIDRHSSDKADSMHYEYCPAVIKRKKFKSFTNGFTWEQKDNAYGFMRLCAIDGDWG